MQWQGALDALWELELLGITPLTLALIELLGITPLDKQTAQYKDNELETQCT